jgi:predicted small secreted protein
MKRKVFLALALLALMATVLAGCASMILVGVDSESAKGPSQVRQYSSINPKDISVIGFYKDGSSKPINISSSNITFDSGSPGPQTVTVKTSVGTVTFQTEVMALTGITVTSQPNALKLGVAVDPKWPGLEVQGAWDQMGSEKINIAECRITGLDTNKAGAQTVTVAWKDKQATFSAQVVAMESIKIVSNPTKTTYYQGDTLDLSGIKVVGVWPGIGEDAIAVSASDASGFNSANKGMKTITITKNGKTATFTVEVADIIGILNGTWVYTSPIWASLEKDAPIVGKMTITYTFNNGSFTYTNIREITAGEYAGTEQGRATGTYTIDTAPGTADYAVTTPAVWHGKVVLTRTGGDSINFRPWTAFSISTNPRIMLEGEVKGTVLVTNDGSTRAWYVKQ